MSSVVIFFRKGFGRTITEVGVESYRYDRNNLVITYKDKSKRDKKIPLYKVEKVK